MMTPLQDREFIYIDPNAAYIDDNVEGDGTTPTSPLWHFPTTMSADVIYLIRRSANEYSAGITAGTTLSTSDFIIWGMPTSTDDEIYQYLPDSVITTWFAEDTSVTKAYAYITLNNSGSSRALTLSGCTSIWMTNITFQTAGSRSSNSLYSMYTTAASVYCNNVYFRELGVDFPQGTDQIANLDSNGFGMYLYCNYSTTTIPHLCKFTNCTINANVQSSSIYLGSAKILQFEHITINTCPCNSESVSVFSWYTDDSNYIYPTIYVTDLQSTHYYWSIDSASSYIKPIFYGTCARMYVDTASLTIDKDQTCGTTTYSSRMYQGPLFRMVLQGPGSVFENITIDLGNFVAGWNHTVMYLQRNDNMYTSDCHGQYITVKNINITACAADTTPTFNGHSTTTISASPWTNNSSYNSLLMLTSSSEYSYNAAVDYIVSNININAPRGNALYAQYAILDLEDSDIIGACRLRRCAGKIGSIESWYPSAILSDGYNNILHIGSMTCNKNNPSVEYTGQAALTRDTPYCSNILCTTTNTLFCTAGTSTNTTMSPNLYICTNNTVTGNYTASNARNKCETWSIYRTGSVTDCSLKFSNETGSSATQPLRVGGRPFKGITSTVSAGSYIATIYLTMYGYNDYADIASHFQCLINISDTDHISSVITGVWTEDTTSEWNNIEQGTAYKLEIPFTIAETTDDEGNTITEYEVEFEYSWQWYMAGAATYVDPYPVITTITTE